MAGEGFGIMGMVDLHYWHEFTDYVDRTEDRAAMWAIRETGRRIQPIAKGIVPVDTGTWHSPSTIRGSIKNARNVKSTGNHGFSLSVGPMGPPQFLYAGKIEAMYGYMAAALAAAEAILPSVWEQAQSMMFAKYG